ncbi:hypothetical protein DGo_PC0004 (plasmid) [Deinococcus gobiensis I-0]|uniref:Uncharacterized protein n=1 Tax=Deinococcus gobiensis (strain DSM 21396 / JCM 16679 / CGMCC 1.7299 / I-0) TaxID=745776 RepID=H8H2P9_DEIGI|nr:hypothetical protein DGo_PC0004 [Deinococcus gobiensis I-0]
MLPFVMPHCAQDAIHRKVSGAEASTSIPLSANTLASQISFLDMPHDTEDQISFPSNFDMSPISTQIA